ncbi:MAG: hypothetical protein AB7O70_10430 [Hyphomicrobiales bacterium]
MSTPRGATVNVLLTGDGEKASANLMLLVGGSGVIRLNPDLPGTRHRNFLTRSRHLFAAGGYLAASVDAPSDRLSKDGLAGFRMTADHADDLAAVARALAARNGKPVVVVGTSRGSVSAGNAAIRLGPDIVRAAVLSSSLTDRAGKPDSLKEMNMADARIPVFFLHNRGDKCRWTPLSSVEQIRSGMVKAGRTADLAVLESTHADADNPCWALTPHGFQGIEQQAVDAILVWIGSQLAARPDGIVTPR